MIRVLLIALLIALRAGAATYYVNSSTGNDSNNGSSGSPWLTLYTSIPKLNAGDTLMISGSYNEPKPGGGGYEFLPSGTPTLPITLEGSGTATITIPSGAGSGICNYQFEGNYLVFDGINFTSSGNPVAYGGGIWLNGSACIVKNCVFHDGQGDYLSMTGQDHLIGIVNQGNFNTYSNVQFINWNDADLWRAWGYTNLITHAFCSNCANAHADYGGVSQDHADLIQFFAGGSGYNVFEDSVVVQHGASGGMLNCTDGTGTVCDCGSKGWVYRNNVFYNSGSQPIQDALDTLHLYNNVFYNWTFGFVTYVDPTVPGPCSPGQNLQCLNNAFISSGGDAQYGVPTNINVNWNVIDLASSNNWNRFSRPLNGNNNIILTVDPGFVNPTGGDFHLKATSPLRNVGINLWNDPSASRVDKDGNARPQNGAWDIGAYQYGSVNNTNPVTQPSVSTLQFQFALTNTSTSLQFNVMNTGSGILTGAIYGASAPFSLIGQTNYTLANGQSQNFTVGFNPTVSNTFTGSIGFNDNGGGSNISVSLFGQANILLTSPFAALSGTLTNWTVSGSSIYQPFDTVTIGAPGQAVGYWWFSVPTTTNYSITAIALAPTESQNSFWISIDQPPADPSFIWDIEPAIPVTTNALVSLRGAGTSTTDQFQPFYWLLSAGPHLLTLYGRENGAQVSQFTINGPSAGKAPLVTGPSSVTNDLLSGFSMSVSVTGTTPIFFQWISNSVALSGQTNPSFLNLPTTTGTNTYGCIVTNAFGSVTNAAFGVLTNGTVPTFALAPPSTYSNSTNGGINLAAVAIGTPPVTFRWETNSVFIPGAISPNYSLVPAPAATNTYILQANNIYGTLNSAGTVVSITNGVSVAVITNQPQSRTNLRVAGFTLIVGASGTPPITYQWQKNSNNISFTDSAIFIGPCTTNDSGYYRCAVSNAFGGIYSANAYVSMTNGTLPAGIGPTNWTAGTNIGIQMYFALTKGDAYQGFPIKYQWSVLGTNISGATSSNLVLTSVAAQTNTYTIAVTNFEGGTNYSAVAQITNLSSGNPPLVITQPLGTTNRTGTAACYFMNVSVTGDLPIHYQWRKNAAAQPQYSGNNASGVYFCPTTTLQTGNWDCVLTNVSGSVTSSVASILFTNQIAPPIAISSSSQAGTIFTYNLATVSFSSAGSYSPIGLPLSYLWSFGDGTTSTNANPTHVFSGGFYAVRMSVSDGVNPPVFATDIDLLVMPFQAFGAGGLYLKKLMF